MDRVDDDDPCSSATPSTLRSLPFASFSSSSFSLPGFSSPSTSERTHGSGSLRATNSSPSLLRFSPSSSRFQQGSHDSTIRTADSGTSKLSSLPNSSKSRDASFCGAKRSKTSSEDILTAIQGDDSWICAIAEGRGTGKEVGVAMLESGTGRCVLSQASI
jgi:hypothetical protein